MNLVMSLYWFKFEINIFISLILPLMWGWKSRTSFFLKGEILLKWEENQWPLHIINYKTDKTNGNTVSSLKYSCRPIPVGSRPVYVLLTLTVRLDRNGEKGVDTEREIRRFRIPLWRETKGDWCRCDDPKWPNGRGVLCGVEVWRRLYPVRRK